MKALVTDVLAGLVLWAIGVLLQIWIIPFGSPSQVAAFWIIYVGVLFVGTVLVYLFAPRSK